MHIMWKIWPGRLITQSQASIFIRRFCATVQEPCSFKNKAKRWVSTYKIRGKLRYSERVYTEIVCDFWENAYISWFWSNIERTYSPIKDIHITSKNIHGICSIYDKDVYFSTPLPPEKKHLPNKQTHAHIVASTLTYTHTRIHLIY